MKASLRNSLFVSLLSFGLSLGFALSANAAINGSANGFSEASTPKSLANRTYEWCMVREANKKIRSSMACMNGEYQRINSAIAGVEKKLLSCSDVRQSENPSMRRKINTEVIVRMLRLRNQDYALASSLKTSAGFIGPRKSRSLELEAALEHLVAVRSLSAEVCDVVRFANFMNQ